MATSVRLGSDAVPVGRFVRGPVKVVCVDPRTDLLWQQLVERQNGGVFSSPEWVRVLVQTYGLEVRALVALDASGEPWAGIPYCQIEDIIGKRIVSLPFSDYCDPLVDDAYGWNHLIARLMVERSPIFLRCLHNDLPLGDERFTLVKQAKWHGLDLQPDLETLWHGFDDSARRAIRKAQRDGLVVRVAEREEELRAFFDMHLGIRKHKYHLLAQPYCFFQNIWRNIIEQGKGLLMLAVYEGEIVGGVLFLERGDTLYYKFNASLPTHLSHRPNDLVIWTAIQYGKAKGYSHLDFGLSDWDQDELVRYKRKYASEERAISFLRYEPDGGGPSRREKELRQLLNQITDLFVDESVPDGVTARAGDALYRYFV